MSHRLRQILIVTSIVAGIGAGNQPAGPKSPIARKILRDQDAAIAKARDDYDTAVRAAEKKVVADADLALGKLTGKDADTIAELNAIRKDTEERLKAEPALEVPKATTTDGHWHQRGTWGDNHISVANGIAHNTTDPADVGHANIEDGSIVIRWGAGVIDRLTGAGGSAFVMENWNRDASRNYPKSLPSGYGRADAE